MLEAFSSLYNRFFGSSVSAETSNKPQPSNTSSPKEFFSGWNITFLFGTRASKNSTEGSSNAPKISLLQRIVPYFFSTSPAPDNAAEGARLSSSSLHNISTLEKSPIAIPETISLYVDASEEGKKVDIKKQGCGKIEDQQSLTRITDDLNETNRKYNANPTDYIDSFNKDANRGFLYTLENGSFSSSPVTNRNAEDLPTTTNEYESNPRVQQAHKVIETLAETIFPNEDADRTAARTTLGDNLKGISHQALFASPLLAFMKHPPSDGTCLIQGAVSDVNFSYSITDARKIEIKATGSYQDANANLLMSAVMNDGNQLEARLLGFPKDGDNNSTGEITGSVSLNIIATVGDDGKITKLNCTSMETSWDAKLK